MPRNNFPKRPYKKIDFEQKRQLRVNQMFDVVQTKGEILRSDLRKIMLVSDTVFYQLQKRLLDENSNIFSYDKKTQSYSYAYKKPLSCLEVIELRANRPVNLIELAKKRELITA